MSFAYKERFLAPGELSDWAERVGGWVPLYDSNCAKRTLSHGSRSSEMGDMIKLLPLRLKSEWEYPGGWSFRMGGFRATTWGYGN